MMSEWRVLFFFFSLPHAAQWMVGWRGVEKKRRMYVEYVRWLPVFFSSLSFSSSGKERLDWRLGSRTGVIGRGAKPFRLLARDFRLGLAGGGWDRQ